MTREVAASGVWSGAATSRASLEELEARQPMAATFPQGLWTTRQSFPQVYPQPVDKNLASRSDSGRGRLAGPDWKCSSASSWGRVSGCVHIGRACRRLQHAEPTTASGADYSRTGHGADYSTGVGGADYSRQEPDPSPVIVATHAQYSHAQSRLTGATPVLYNYVELDVGSSLTKGNLMAELLMEPELSTLVYCDEWHYLDDYCDDMQDEIAVHVEWDHATGDVTFSVHVGPRLFTIWPTEEEMWKRLVVTIPSNFKCAYDKEA